MKNRFSFRFSIFGFAIFLIISGLSLTRVEAAGLYFTSQSPNIYNGDTFIMELKISTPDKSINVVDGTIIYDSSRLEIKEISTGNSLFALWPKPPVFSNDKGELSFVGGVSDGFQGDGGSILRIVFIAKNEGKAQIDFLDGFLVFLNDGKGTSINPWLRPLSLNISKKPADVSPKDEWKEFMEKDKIPPEPLEILIGREPTAFDNQYFISFFTTDKESGVDYYEVQEGNKPFVKAESPYLLQDQTLGNMIRVRAVDKAGNERITETIRAKPFYENMMFWLITLGILGIAYLIWRIIKAILKIKDKNEE